MAALNYSRPITHVGVAVTDMEAAINWYKRVLGFQLFFGPIDFAADETYFGKLASDVFKTDFKRGRLAHMGTSNQVGLELFEFIEPKSEQRKDNFEYWKNGFFHICVIDSDVEGLARRIAESGGKQRTAVWELFEGTGYKFAYCEDPFGNIIEIYSHSTEQIWSNR